MASRANDAAKDIIQRMRQESPDKHRVLRVGGAFAGIITLMIAGTTAIGGTLVTLLLASPFLIAFSPVLIPLAILATLAVGGVVSFLVFVAAVAWSYRYAKGRRPVGSHQVDMAKNRIVDTANHVTEKAKEVGSNVSGYLHNKAG